MPCNSSNSNPTNISGIQLFYQTANQCSTATNSCTTDIRTMSYNGPVLPCSNIATGTNMEDVLIAFDTKLCAVTGNYATYNKACLDDGGAITTEQQFVEQISSFVCNLRSDYDTFVGVTFEAYKTSVTANFSAINNPNLTSCVAVGIVPTDSLTQVLNKLHTAICDIHSTHLSFSSVNWSQCFTSSVPSSLPEALDILIDQICLVKTEVAGAGGALPTFNNTSSCLETPTATDSLVDTVTKIRTRLCQTPTFDINNLTWACVTKPSNTATDLQGAFQAILNKLSTISQNLPVFSSDFQVAPVNASDPCLGKSISLSPGGGVTDRYVAVSGLDTSPGTLVQKLQAGTGITLDTTTTPGQMIINSSGGSGNDEKVKTSSSSASAGYLVDKIVAQSNSFGIVPSISNDTVADTLVISNVINLGILADQLLEYIKGDTALMAKFCELKNECPSPCGGPTNVTVTYVSGTTTTTTTV